MVAAGIALARVLIVDDVEIVRKALELGVRKLGHEAEGTSDPVQALQLAEQHPPDLALVDYRMPGMDGVTFFGELRRRLGDRCPKVLFVTATPPEEVAERLAPAGLKPHGFVKKPFHLDDLWKTVRVVLGNGT